MTGQWAIPCGGTVGGQQPGHGAGGCGPRAAQPGAGAQRGVASGVQPRRRPGRRLDGLLGRDHCHLTGGQTWTETGSMHSGFVGNHHRRLGSLKRTLSVRLDTVWPPSLTALTADSKSSYTTNPNPWQTRPDVRQSPGLWRGAEHCGAPWRRSIDRWTPRCHTSQRLVAELPLKHRRAAHQ